MNTEIGKPAQCKKENRWNQNGVKASTTGNIYGIYDMAGGAYEYIMGLIINKEGTEPYYNSNYSGFNSGNMPEHKYYDLYSYSENANSYGRSHYGDASKEVLQAYNTEWNSDHGDFPHINSYEVTPWVLRGGTYRLGDKSGIFTSYRNSGQAVGYFSFRSVLSAA